MSDQRWVEKPPAGNEAWREVWRDDLGFRVEDRGLKGSIRRFLRRIVRSASREEAERQKTFNIVLLELLEDRRIELDQRAGALEERVASFESLMRVVVERNDALLGAVDRKAETALVRIRDLASPLLESPKSETSREEWLYRRLEEGLRGSDREVREALRPYADYAAGSTPVLDVGCGRGEFLELCREAGLEARGYDTNERSVADVRARGLEAEIGAVPGCLGVHADGSIGSILASHVVEHLPVGALIGLFAESKRVLRGGGLLMIETPNAESLSVSASDFWRDPTHLGPRHLAALTLLGREFGFSVEEARTVHAFPESRRLRLPETASADVRLLAEQLERILFGDQDLRLVLRKSS